MRFFSESTFLEQIFTVHILLAIAQLKSVKELWGIKLN